MNQHKPTGAEKLCLFCAKPILRTRNNATIWARLEYCDNACKRMANRKIPREIDANANRKGPSQHKKR